MEAHTLAFGKIRPPPPAHFLISIKECSTILLEVILSRYSKLHWKWPSKLCQDAYGEIQSDCLMIRINLVNLIMMEINWCRWMYCWGFVKMIYNSELAYHETYSDIKLRSPMSSEKCASSSKPRIRLTQYTRLANSQCKWNRNYRIIRRILRISKVVEISNMWFQ